MVSRQAALALLKEALPGHDLIIERAYRESAAFRDLCLDFRTCTLALERWRGLDGDEATQRTQEYTQLLAELTSEIESGLASMAGDSAAPRLKAGT